ncbi:WXG100 family type VII secretion target [Micromonospora sp. NBC_00421]|uniref:WXG100 family type VII secretion target n=1 Tax=Micromonospora sp. NBC_00421 TaxID=2975976 RepID=UPI002E1CF789
MTNTPGLGQVHATQEQLNQMAQRCNDTGAGLAQGMAQLIDRVQTLGGGGMRGSANNALQDVSVQLNDGLKKIISALDELSGKMTSAATQYGMNDDDAATEIRQAAAETGNADVMSILRG